MKAQYARISPFVFKNLLVDHAREVRGNEAPLLDASRGAANWQQRDVLLAWHVLGLYADYSYGSCGEPPTARLITPTPIDHQATFQRFYEGLTEQREGLDMGLNYLLKVWAYLSDEVFPELAEKVIIERFTEAVSGAAYPQPATLDFVGPILARYLAPLLLDNDLDAASRLQIHLAPGVTAAIGLVVQTLAHGGLLTPGDKVAVMRPGYRPLRDLFTHHYGCQVVEVEQAADGEVAPEEWEVLLDPTVRLLALATPGNPLPCTLSPAALDGLGAVMERRGDLLILGDFVYAHLLPVPADNPLHRWPRQTIGFYGPSKDFGLAGARLGAALVHEECVANDLLAARSPQLAEVADDRYSNRLWEPGAAGLMERLAEESNHVAFGHMAGLSTPDQVLMCLCACYDAVTGTTGKAFFDFVQGELARRERTLYEALQLPLPATAEGAASSHYAALLDLSRLAVQSGPGVSEGLERHDIWELLFHLAHSEGVIMMPGLAFGGPPWSVRICLPSLRTPEYHEIGLALRRAVKSLGSEGWCHECQALWDAQ